MDFSRYLDLADPDGPRIVGHRIWLDHLLYQFDEHRRNADQLIERFPTLDRQTVYACLLYFEQNRPMCLTRLYAEIARKQSNAASAAAMNKMKKSEVIRRNVGGEATVVGRP